MRLLRLDRKRFSLRLSGEKPGRKNAERLQEAAKYKLVDQEIFQRIEELLEELVEKIKVESAAFFLSAPHDLLMAVTTGKKSDLKLREFDELLLFSGQPIQNKEYYYQPVENDNKVIGYISTKISAKDSNDLIKGIIDNYASLIFHELELAEKKSKLEDFSDKLLKKKEELEKAQEYNNNLISITSHDLSSPLNAVSGYLDLMNDHIKDDEQGADEIKNYHKRIRSGIQDVMDMLRQLNDISKIERGVISFDLVEVNFIWLVQEVFDLIESKAISKRIKFELKTPEKPIYVRADTVKLKRVIHNLIANAIKYTPVEGKVVVELDHTENLALLSIKDNGIGIPESHYSKIFAPFVKLDPKKDDDTSSSGLGLYVASYFTDLMNGEISVESKEGEGSTFTVSLPLAQEVVVKNIKAV